MEDLMTLSEAAAALRVRESTLRAWRWQKRNLTFRKIGRLLRVSRKDVDSLIARSAQEPNQSEPKVARRKRGGQ